MQSKWYYQVPTWRFGKGKNLWLMVKEVDWISGSH